MCKTNEYRNCVGGYKEILQSIDLHKEIKGAADLNYKYYRKILHQGSPAEVGSINYDGMPKGSRNYKDPAETMTEMLRWQHMSEIEEEIINGLYEKKKAIDKCIDNITDITVKVSMLRTMGLTQEQVAELIDRSPRQIQNIEKKIRESV